MPSTVNGVGTTYYGHSNSQARVGVCRSCGHSGRLESYDTRLWFVVIFIPIIPLGRKRIIDQCPNCQRHFVASKDEYEMSRQLGISAAQEHFRERPSPQTALEVHATLLAYHDHEGAEAFSQEALKQFPTNGELCVGLAAHMEQVGRYADAEKFYDQAWELRPDLPQVRDAQARKKISENKLDEARELLDFLMHAGAGQTYSFGTLDQLAYAYQQQGRHEESLQLYQHLVAEFPFVAQQHQFRKVVQNSEKALGRHETILPQAQGGWLSLLNYKSTVHAPWKKWTAIGSVISALVLIGLFVNNDYKRRHRTIHVLNAFPEAATIQVDNEKPTMINGRGTLTVAEGPHHIKVTGPIQDEIDINPQSTFFDRWMKNSAWVLNLGAREVLCEWRITYAKNAPPSVPRIIANDKFVFIPHVDYIFTDPPAKVEVKNGQQQVIKTQLTVLQQDPADVFPELLKTGPDAALDFAETQLAYVPHNIILLGQYINTAESVKQQNRAEKYLDAGRQRRPIDVNWHRYYQNLLENSQRDEQILAEYTKLLEADPQNGALLYLCGRIEPDDAKAVELLNRATVAGPQLPWPWYALATRSAAAGDWAQAAEEVEKARARKMEPLQVENLRHTVLLASGGAAKLEQEYRDHLKSNPTDARIVLYLCDVLAVTGQPDAARAALANWENSIPPEFRGSASAALSMIQKTVNYQLGDFQAKPAVESQHPATEQIRADLLLAEGQTDLALKNDVLAETVWANSWNALTLSVAFGLQSRGDQADDWRQRAIKLLEAGGQDERRVAKLLQADSPPTLEVARRATHLVNHQLRMLAALAQRFPDSAELYTAEIAKLNISRFPPYQVVQQLVKPAAAE